MTLHYYFKLDKLDKETLFKRRLYSNSLSQFHFKLPYKSIINHLIFINTLIFLI